ncbi:hypothetical protein KIN20_031184 [Parelaphostrongylus tenuis]|uniref:Uncharacterized protein n=1 Tax=Parelaphostrongylus tenuis TaxID=148309 RepID=A0AAD5R573_PARTN|nr:hypothetical protein KIN20_031184 [Parelaphostrongylus tenuis]
MSLRKVACGLHDLQDQLSKKVRVEETNRNEQQVEAPKPPFPQPFYRQQDPNEEVNRKFRKFADETLRTLTHYRTKRFQSNLTELQKRGMKEVRELIREGRIRLLVSDKGGESVVIPLQLDIAITNNHLEDASLYRSSYRN